MAFLIPPPPQSSSLRPGAEPRAQCYSCLLRPLLCVPARISAETFSITADPWLLTADLSQCGERVEGTLFAWALHCLQAFLSCCPLRRNITLCLHVPWALRWSQQGAPCPLGPGLFCALCISLQHEWLPGVGETAGLLGIPLPSTLSLSLNHQ